jgi:hypothetical protein
MNSSSEIALRSEVLQQCVLPEVSFEEWYTFAITGLVGSIMSTIRTILSQISPLGIIKALISSFKNKLRQYCLATVVAGFFGACKGSIMDWLRTLNVARSNVIRNFVMMWITNFYVKNLVKWYLTRGKVELVEPLCDSYTTYKDKTKCFDARSESVAYRVARGQVEQFSRSRRSDGQWIPGRPLETQEISRGQFVIFADHGEATPLVPMFEFGISKVARRVKGPLSHAYMLHTTGHVLDTIGSVNVTDGQLYVSYKSGEEIDEMRSAQSVKEVFADCPSILAMFSCQTKQDVKAFSHMQGVDLFPKVNLTMHNTQDNKRYNVETRYDTCTVVMDTAREQRCLLDALSRFQQRTVQAYQIMEKTPPNGKIREHNVYIHNKPMNNRVAVNQGHCLTDAGSSYLSKLYHCIGHITSPFQDLTLVRKPAGLLTPEFTMYVPSYHGPVVSTHLDSCGYCPSASGRTIFCHGTKKETVTFSVGIHMGGYGEGEGIVNYYADIDFIFTHAGKKCGIELYASESIKGKSLTDVAERIYDRVTDTTMLRQYAGLQESKKRNIFPCRPESVGPSGGGIDQSDVSSEIADSFYENQDVDDLDLDDLIDADENHWKHQAKMVEDDARDEANQVNEAQGHADRETGYNLNVDAGAAAFGGTQIRYRHGGRASSSSYMPGQGAIDGWEESVTCNGLKVFNICDDELLDYELKQSGDVEHLESGEPFDEWDERYEYYRRLVIKAQSVHEELRSMPSRPGMDKAEWCAHLESMIGRPESVKFASSIKSLNLEPVRSPVATQTQRNRHKKVEQRIREMPPIGLLSKKSKPLEKESPPEEKIEDGKVESTHIIAAGTAESRNKPTQEQLMQKEKMSEKYFRHAFRPIRLGGKGKDDSCG